MKPTHITRAPAIGAGVATGLALGLADWVASGVAHSPPSLAVASLAGGLVAGTAAGLVGSLAARPALGPGLVLAGGIALEGLSGASKKLTGASFVLAAAATIVIALVVLWLVQYRPGSRWPGSRRSEWIGAALSLPAGAWLASYLGAPPLLQVLAAATPLAWILLARRCTGRARLVSAWPLLLLTAAQGREVPGVRLQTHASTAQSSGPSVVLLVIDTLRADALPQDGQLATFARAGTRFRQCVSAAPWTLPSVASLLTGLYPSQHGAVEAATPLPQDVLTLAELLREHGWATAAFTGGAFVGPGHRMDQGFDLFDSQCERRFPPFEHHTPLVWRLAKNRYFPLRWLVRRVDEYVGFAGVAAAAEAWARAEPRGPRFLLLHTYEVHDYYLYDGDVDDDVRHTAGQAPGRFARRLSVHPSELTRASQSELDYFQALYRGRLAHVEQVFGELLESLTAALGEDTLWIVTADHGEGFEAHSGRVHHGGRLHDDLLRVPLIVRAPGRLEPGRVVEQQVRTVDVLPTLCDLLGIPTPEGLAGSSLLPALEGRGAFPATAFAEELAHGFDLLAVRRSDWKLIRGPGLEQLYHLAQDPAEASDLERKPPENMSAELQRFRERHPLRQREALELDAATLQHLRALGYVD